MILCGYDMESEAVFDLLVEVCTTVGPDKLLGTGFRVFYPEMAGAADLAARAEAAGRAGVESINFYNYGLIPKARLGWVAEACRAAKSVT